MREGWEMKKLGEVCDFVRGPFGGSLKKNCFVNKGFAVYEQQHAIYNQFNDIRYFIDDKKFAEMKRFELRSGDLIMSCSGTMGKVSIVPNGITRGIINQALLKLTPKSSLNIQYLKYWMDSEGFTQSILKHSKGAAIKNIASVQVLKTILLPYPHLSEQQQIVSILDKTFAAIDEAKANTEKNLNNAKELFQSQLNKVFSEKGEGWVEKKLGEVCEVVGGGTPSKAKKEYYDGDILWATVRDMNVDFLKNTEVKISDLGLKNSSTRLIKKGNVIIATRVGLGKICILEKDSAINQDLKGILPKKEYNISTEFLFWWCKSIAKKIQNAGTGLTVLGVKLDFINSLSFPILSFKEQQKIVSQLNHLSAETKKLEARYQQKLVELEDLKKSIFEKAFKGELTEKEIAV